MEKSETVNTYKPFNGAAWFEKQVHRRTRVALAERGSTAKSNSFEYRREYQRQLAAFRAIRWEKKAEKAKKHAEREARRIEKAEALE